MLCPAFLTTQSTKTTNSGLFLNPMQQLTQKQNNKARRNHVSLKAQDGRSSSESFDQD